MAKLNQKGRLPKTLLVLDNAKLIGSVTDGDIRRSFLSGFSLNSLVSEICKKDPIVAHDGMTDEDMGRLAHANRIYCLPIVDKNGNVLKVKVLDQEEIGHKGEHVIAVIMAGGDGTRLGALTEKTPKPMLRVNGKPILQIIIEALRDNGIRKIYINIRYLGEIIKDYFKDGLCFGVEIEYIIEPKPMGTAGSLSLIPEHLLPKSSFLVLNGDVLTTLDFQSFYNFHTVAKYDFTLCGRPYEVKIPFGYPTIEGDIVTAFREKPTLTYFVNSGIYSISPCLINKVPVGKYFNMPDLIRAAIEDGARVGMFPLREEFHEIGRPESYRAAEEFYRKYMLQKGKKEG
jgi:NDP-sugar pyrophosphorylase family protein